MEYSDKVVILGYYYSGTDMNGNETTSPFTVGLTGDIIVDYERIIQEEVSASFCSWNVQGSDDVIKIKKRYQLKKFLDEGV